MSRLSPFNSPLLLGFDQLERMLERVAKSAGDGYPPYNIAQIGENRLRITLAVAGFAEPELGVTVENSQLHIRGVKAEIQDDGTVYLYRGIAARQFHRTFLLAEGIEVTNATLENGLLHIDLERPLAPQSVRNIRIATAGAQPDQRARAPGLRDELHQEQGQAEQVPVRRILGSSGRERSNGS